MKNDQLVALAKGLVNAAAEKNIALRVLGGIAVLMTCESVATHPTLQRENADLDLVAPRKDWNAAVQIFATQGLNPGRRIETEFAFEKDGVKIEVGDTSFGEDFRIDLAQRLSLNSPTLPLADLLLIKLQRRNFAEKDIKDSIALLLDHRVAREETEEQISHAYIAQMTRGNWGRFHIVYDNTITLEKILPQYIESEEAQLVWRRIELIQGAMDRARKSLGWMVNQVLRKPTEVPR